ncbi:MAG: HEAT repeat domain-containing protein [Bacteroidota bacterium]
MNQQEDITYILSCYQEGALTEQEEKRLEEYLENGLIQLSDLPDLAKLDAQLGVALQEVPVTSRPLMIKEAHPSAFSNFLKEAGEKLQQLFTPTPRISLAYTFLLVGFGVLITSWYFQNQNQKEKIARLEGELTQVKEMMLLTLLDKESTGERLKAVQLTRDMPEVSDQIADALLETLKQDDNPNVRLAALEALYPYADQAVVREGLIKTISYQESPLVQWAIAEVMVALQEKRSVEELRKLLSEEQTTDEVKEKIKNSIQVLM